MKLTAVVPIFGPTYVSRKHDIEAILNQSRNTKIILVADSFEDNDKQSINELISNIPHEEIELIQGIFGNPGIARNSALDKVETDWFCFWDSDDSPDTELFVKMITDAQSGGFTIAKGAYRKVYANQESEIISILHETPPSKSFEHLIDPGLWRYAFSTASHGLLRFPSQKMGEDQCFLVQALLSQPDVYQSKEVVYNYRIGYGAQLTSNLENVSDLKLSLVFLQDICNSNKSNKLGTKVVLTAYLKQCLTLLKYRNQISIKSFQIFKFLFVNLVKGRLWIPANTILKSRMNFRRSQESISSNKVRKLD